MQEDGILGQSSHLSQQHTGYYRPFVLLTYVLDYRIWGMNPKGFRATNVLLHLAACIILFQCLLFFTGNCYAAFCATAFFALHPVNTESVAIATSRNNILVTLFSLGSFFCYVKSWQGNRSYFLLLVSVFLFALSVCSKEFGVMTLPFLTVYHLFLSPRRDSVFRIGARLIPFILILIAYIVLRKSIIGSWVTPAPGDDFWVRLFFVPYVFLINLKIIFFPHDLHSFITPYPEHYLNGQVILGYAGLICYVFLLWRFWENRFIRFSLISFLIALVPILNIFKTSAVTIVSMRWLYFPMVFISFGLAAAISKIRLIKGATAGIIVTAVCLYLGLYSFILNKYLWHDESTFFTQEVYRFSNDFYTVGLGDYLFQKGDYRLAEKCFQKAIRLYPKSSGNIISYSSLLVNTGRPTEAIELLKNNKALRMSAVEHAHWHNNLAAAFFKLDDLEKAEMHLNAALDFLPDGAFLWENIGVRHALSGDYMAATDSLKRGLQLDPDSVSIRMKLAECYRRIGDSASALRHLKQIPRTHWPNNGIEKIIQKIEMDPDGTSK